MDNFLDITQYFLAMYLAKIKWSEKMTEKDLFKARRTVQNFVDATFAVASILANHQNLYQILLNLSLFYCIYGRLYLQGLVVLKRFNKPILKLLDIVENSVLIWNLLLSFIENQQWIYLILSIAFIFDNFLNIIEFFIQLRKLRKENVEIERNLASRKTVFKLLFTALIKKKSRLLGYSLGLSFSIIYCFYVSVILYLLEDEIFFFVQHLINFIFCFIILIIVYIKSKDDNCQKIKEGSVDEKCYNLENRSQEKNETQIKIQHMKQLSEGILYGFVMSATASTFVIIYIFSLKWRVKKQIQVHPIFDLS